MTPSRKRQYIALLRGVNLGGHKKVPMADLRAMLTDLGYADVRTLLQSGNVLLGASEKPDALARRLEAETARRLGVTTEYLIRTATEWAGVIRANPFPAEAQNDPARLLVWFLRGAAPRGAQAALEAAVVGRERVRVVKREVFVFFPDGQGGSKFTTAILDRHLAQRGTGRNWNTVMKLAAAAGL